MSAEEDLLSNWLEERDQHTELKKRYEELEAYNERLKDTIVEMIGCSEANLCTGCMLAAKCAIENKNLSDLFKESKYK